ncbi:hypothetical protein TSUD_301490 [Trifolium subterraneum]|uniref:Uncharacterized protein n=1 Tax=Trifolium subterraneum TaxID=3900 RepID=A0A2Z6NME2_TRISU|nr:hypothetical protein TSUD_301490 [Trifolium subterraneum]
MEVFTKQSCLHHTPSVPYYKKKKTIKVMPFGLKNAGATYQRLMDRVFADQIGKNLEVHIDDVVVKTEEEGDHDKDLADILGSGNRGKSREMSSHHRHEEPTSVKEVQQLTGRMDALSRFLYCAGEKTFHFFATLRKSERFTWSPQCEEAFQKLKIFLASPPILSRPEQGEEKPLYFISRTLRGAETRYQKIEMLSLAVVVTARRLRQYFQSHKLIVKTDYPIKNVLRKPDLAGRMVACDLQPWTLTVDGSSNIRGSGAGVVLEGLDGVLIEQSLRFAFKASNNQVEYEALIAGMKLSKEMDVQELKVQSDSQLVANQVAWEFQTKDPHLAKYLEKVKEMTKHFTMFELVYVPREQNSRADLLASTKKSGNHRTVIQETLKSPSINEVMIGMVIEEEDLRSHMIRYLQKDILPRERDEALKVRNTAVWFTMVEDKVYKRGFSTPMLLCVSEEEASRILNEIHEGSCGSHIGAKPLARKVMKVGFYWPNLHDGATRHVRPCDKCQRYSNLHHAPGEPLKSVLSPWPFFMWGVDILGPFPTSTAQAKWIIVVVDYFTKWVEAESVSSISADQVKKFYWKKIICRFGLPKYIVSDNGTQFASKKIVEYRREMGIQNTFISVEHPEANGQVESANKVILRALNMKVGLNISRGYCGHIIQRHNL